MQLPCKIILLLSLALAGCTSDPYQGIYEGIKSHNEGMKTPNERMMTTPTPSYDSYKKEREQMKQTDPATEKTVAP